MRWKVYARRDGDVRKWEFATQCEALAKYRGLRASDYHDAILADEDEPVQRKWRCLNCGDATTFPEGSNGERYETGWCSPCFTKWRKQSEDGVWHDTKTLYNNAWWRSRAPRAV